MSKQNKVNKTNYVQRGRLTPDDMARERLAADKPRRSAAEASQAVRGKRTERIKGNAGRAANRPRSAPEE